MATVMSPLPLALREGWRFFCANPVREAALALLFFLGGLTGLFLGPAANLWLWHLEPNKPEETLLGDTLLGPLVGQMALAQRLQVPHRLATCFWLGLLLWCVALIPAAHATLLGFIPVGLLLIQPLWLALVLADRFALPFGVACRATCNFIADAPGRAFGAMALGLAGGLGALLFFVGLFITLPVANRALLLWLSRCHADLAAAIQRAYP